MTCRTIAVSLAWFALAASAPAQDPAPGEPPAPEPAPETPDPEAPEPETPTPDDPHLGVPPLPGMSETNDLQAQMEELFATVERNLQRIDLMLSDAAAGDASLAEVEDAGLDDLLQSGRERSQEVVRDIDQILELARQAGSGKGGLSNQPPPPSGESELDRRRPDGTRQREETPEAPKPEPSSSQPHDSQDPKDGEQPPPDTEPANREGQPQQHESGDPAGTNPDADQWGELPPHVQQVFRAEGADDMPVQYRDWIDAYYRRLNRRR